MASLVRMLQRQWRHSCDRLTRRLDGLSDEELRWEPVSPCWNVRPADTAGRWTVDYPDVTPEPPPFTSIAWRLLHISDGNTIYWEHAFGPRRRQLWELEPHGTAGGAIEYLESQRPITETLAVLDDDGLDETRPTHFGDAWPASRVFAVLIDEQLHHGAEVALLRDRYRDRRTLSA